MATFPSNHDAHPQPPPRTYSSPRHSPSPTPHHPPHHPHDRLSRLDKAFRPLIDNSPVISRCAIHHDRPSCLCNRSTDPNKHLNDESPVNPHRGHVSPRLHFDIGNEGGSTPPGMMQLKPLSLRSGGTGGERELFMGGVEGVKEKEEKEMFLGDEDIGDGGATSRDTLEEAFDSDVGPKAGLVPIVDPIQVSEKIEETQQEEESAS